MSDQIRKLNKDGIAAFAAYLQIMRNAGTDPAPFQLLTDPAFSEEMEGSVTVERQVFKDPFELGSYLATTLNPFDRRQIAYDFRLWSWLALYFLDNLCPPNATGKREVLEDALYILGETFNHQRYYRHLLRTPWLAVADNGENGRILLINKLGGKRSEISEQLASRQGIFGNKTVIAGAYGLYYDPSAKTFKKGAGGKAGGSVRRLVSFIRQIDLTYDLRDCTPEQFLSLLPSEFDKFKGISPVAVSRNKRPTGIRSILSKVILGSPVKGTEATASTD